MRVNRIGLELYCKMKIIKLRIFLDVIIYFSPMNSCINLPSPLYTTNNTILQYIVYETDSTIAIQNFNI